ncbi:MAG: methyltransferase domain-containing protein [Candidatus Thiodiazotropha sp. (ex Lucina aurantia)]|uniref:Methyltransferase type 11 domain-containing protein n=2 Tax=Candidatus Thiodiazotropha TaxID=1913444 RepID=A0A7Z0VJQ4_9GAMM|nr:class I SAM-dependent methyltransferase [Candidatus Thiodiazotropha endolucinida]MBT3011177.1 methyltransferase domain-containing protein [Candidatus Thiodiazotropha sp. (ex Lucina pensylvanica)]MBT3015496.1 methyltransferase domain-containing protein [Candidatus Thiodiazotropha taylori]MBV2099956.1 methyltransferase domain-containing protein [Candidatus Thiodiazotropha sp. (ex Codakia orbicularis)]MBV2103119.1 methyltransferase domain-containing protein [Candidatus Thiodiazotropha sp. (ex L
MTEDYWGRFSETYDRNQEYVVGRELLDEITGELNQLAELGEVVEFGCGTGYFTVAITEKSTSVLATDLSDNLLEAAKTRLRDHPEVTVQKEDCLETSLMPESCNSVFMANLVHVLATPAKALEESSRILRSGGRIVIVTFTGHGMSLWQKIKMGVRFAKTWGKPPPNIRSFSPEDVESMLQETGFVVEQSKLIGNRTKALFVVGRKG